MANDSMCFPQTPHSLVPLHPPADDRAAPAGGVAPPRRVAPGVAGVNAVPRPAANEKPKLLVPADKAAKQAEEAYDALERAERTLDALIARKAPSEQIDDARASVYAAQRNAESATREYLRDAAMRPLPGL
jgi:hypothetical protein